MDTIKIIIALLLIAGSAFAGSYRVHYNVRGSGRDITVQAESSRRGAPHAYGLNPRRCRHRRSPQVI